MLCRGLLGVCAAAWSCCYMLLLNHNPLHIVIIYEHMALWLWAAFFIGQEVWKSHDSKSPAAWISVGPLVCGLYRNGHCWAAGWCHLWVYNEVFLDCGMQLFNRLTVCLHWRCHYMIWSLSTGGLWCLSGLLKMESIPGMTSLSYAVMSSVPADQLVNCTVLHNCLLLCLLSPVCLCAIYTTTAAP